MVVETVTVARVLVNCAVAAVCCGCWRGSAHQHFLGFQVLVSDCLMMLRSEPIVLDKTVHSYRRGYCCTTFKVLYNLPAKIITFLPDAHHFLTVGATVFFSVFYDLYVLCVIYV